MQCLHCECRPWPKQDHLRLATHCHVPCLYLACLSWLLIKFWRRWPIFVLCFHVTCKHCTFCHTLHFILLYPLWVWHLCIHEFFFSSHAKYFYLLLHSLLTPSSLLHNLRSTWFPQVHSCLRWSLQALGCSFLLCSNIHAPLSPLPP
jgi:hypothetical protein